MEVTNFVGHLLGSDIRSKVDNYIEEGVKDRNPTTEVVCECCFSPVILWKEKKHHLITAIQRYKAFMLSAVDYVIHDVDCYCNFGGFKWWYSKLGCPGKWFISMQSFHVETSSNKCCFRSWESLRSRFIRRERLIKEASLGWYKHSWSLGMMVGLC